MEISAPDYIRSIHSLCEQLLHLHGDLLRHKRISQKTELIRAIKLDLDKLTHALFEVQGNNADAVLRSFFGHRSINISEVSGSLGSKHIYHVGFEIHEPLDLVLYGINHWIERSNRDLGSNMRVRKFLRFPASEAFERRVGASTEIMRIWLQVNERTLMLELFDIQRPADAMLAGQMKTAYRNFNELLRPEGLTAGHRHRTAGLFAEDEIWHYALYVNGPDDVERLHRAWQQLAARNSDYFVPYAAPVHNAHDGSFHTKIVREPRRESSRMELEFVTQNEGR